VGYKITVDGEDNRGLAGWFVAMTGLTMDVKTHDMPFTGRGEVISGQVVRADSPIMDEPEVMLVQVDMHGRPIEGGSLRSIKVDHVAEVAVW
jgi:hypothetical protein